MSDSFDDAVDAESYDAWLDPDDADYDAWSYEDDGTVVGGFESDNETYEDRNARILERNAAAREADRHREVGPDVIDGARRDAFDPTHAARARSLLTQTAAEHGLTFAGLVAPLPPGRQTAANRERRDLLARAVAQARRQGVTLHVLATVTGRQLAVVHALEQRGAALCG